MPRCIAHVLAKRFDFEALHKQLSSHHTTALYRDTLYLDDAGDTFIFPYGVVVLWGVAHDREQRLLAELSPYLIEPVGEPLHDLFDYVLDSEQPRIHNDQIGLSGDFMMERLAVSHGLAQSVKLGELERYAEQTIEETAHIPRNIANSGHSRLKRRDIARMRGRLFLVESDIHLHHALLDTPEFFWEYPELEGLYAMTAKYLDVRPRIEVLNKKLQVIHDMFDMLADEQKHQHSSLLEWIIIWLIAFEILIFLLHDLLGIF